MQNQMSRTTSLKIARFVITAVLLCVTIIVMIPLYYLLLGSFTDTARLFADGLALYPRWEIMGFFNYVKTVVERDGVYWNWYLNSITITAMYTVGALFLTSLVGYGLGVYHFRGKNFLFVLVLVVMMIPIEILMLPLFSMAVQWGFLNTRLGVILPFLVAGNAVFFFRQFCSGLPLEMMDAGRIDGATEFGIYYHIMVPLMKPAFGAMTILLAMAGWNMFLWPMIVLRGNANLTLPVGLATLLSPYGDNWAFLLPGAVLAVIPVIIVFLFNQKSFVSGLASGGVKG